MCNILYIYIIGDLGKPTVGVYPREIKHRWPLKNFDTIIQTSQVYS